ncbi:hypothetical protein SAMN02745704_00800 [Paucidesulfovibrio gracilis DSM 16080]|uniref:Uncharacterized protein n=1 Tax=Paucidesulfovibrio gracilis DSM 16080 TaxID=1121449 RepID=A0A1T4WCA9_9BACT|nr:trehalose 6-phosphate synthase [Paucidesulfovibrio gracilis]SKA74920.1 hypothetical protein SAMN02745704_00800 [Paucidesulfovibrio gracilis DSM 16080]
MGQGMEPTPIVDLKGFYERMHQTREVRVRAVADIAAGRVPDSALVRVLETTLEDLRNILRPDGKAELEVTPGRSMELDLGYEIGELEKDVLYLRQGEDALLTFLAQLHPDFSQEVSTALNVLQGRSFKAWITDRDGTTNNYCGRYNSSIQSAYNAVFLSRYARVHVGRSVFITSAPLRDPGIVNVSVNPDGSFIYAASKGRECLDLEGARRVFPIEPEKQALLDAFNARMETLLCEPAYGTFTLIGSGYQRKFGQTTIARQDITGTIPEDESKAFLAVIGQVVAEVDPEGRHFYIEDTGLDVEVILTVDDEQGGKDFSKAEGVAFLDQTFALDLQKGPNLVSGDTRSDLPLAQAVLERCPETWVVFVTRDEELAADVRRLTPSSLVVSRPDVLVTALGMLARSDV